MSNSKIYLGSTNLGTGKIRLGANDVSAIYLGSSLLYPPSAPADVNYVTITNTSQNSGTFSVYSSDSNFPNYTNLEYSLDGGTTWTTLNTVYDTVTVPSGGSIFLRGTGNGEDFDNEEFTKLNFSESHTVSGNLANLVDYTAEPQIVPNYAFYKLFNNDTTLTQANLFDTDFDNGGIDAFDRIFSGCSSLNSVSITTNNWNDSKHDNWLTGAAATGTIYVNGDATNLPLNNTSGVPVGWNVGGDFNELCFTANAANCTVGMTNNGSNQPVMYYSTDQTNWTLWDYSNITLANVGDKVYFYGYNPNGFSTSARNSSQFTTSGSVACSGNIMTLITRYGNETTIPSSFCFYNLFNGTTITTAPELPATTLTQSCYHFMFYDTNLTTAPELPATTLATECYYGMFYNCSQLNYIKVGATTWNTGIAVSWVQGVAATGIFIKPYDLQTGTGTGEIPLNNTSGIPTGWTVQNTNGYLCFTVVTAPFTFNLMGDGNAVVYYSTDKTNWNLLNNYSNVTLQNVGDKVYFYGNNPNGFSYSQSNFDVFNTSAGSYSVSGNIMSLIDISCPSTIPNSYCFVSLFSDTSIVSAEHLLLPAQTLTDYCYFDMFARSTLSTPPELQATTLAESCYAFMFDDTDITESPILAVGILPQGCYYRMFRNCSNLNTVTCLATDITAQYCTQNWLENVAATGTFTKSPDMLSWTTGASGIPTGWTVEDEYDCSDCNNYAECGYSSYEECMCQQYGEDCPADPCQECYDACEGDPDCEADCDANECGGGDEPDPCEDCSNWEECGYSDYEDCDCQKNGNCPEEEEPEEEEPEP